VVRSLPDATRLARSANPTSRQADATGPRLYPDGLLCDEFAVGGLAPEAIDVEDVFTDAADGYLEEALALRGLEEDPLLLGQPMPDPAVADLPPGRLPATQSLDVVLVGLGHARNPKAEGSKRKWVGGKVL